MRAGIAFLSLVVTASFLGGCVSHVSGLTGGDPTPPTNTPPTQTPLKVLSALTSTITGSGGAWMAAGDTMTVSASPPANAAGAVTYAWLMGPIAGVGPYPPTSMPSRSPLIQPGTSYPMVFDTAGIWHMHCHPHPWMLSSVTVVDDGKVPQRVVVHFVDGATQGDYRFVPSEVTVSKGSTVVYQNDGAQPHQTMLLHQDAPLKLLPLAAPSGDIKVAGNGWTRVLVAMSDADGRVGYAEHDVYVTDSLPAPVIKKFSGGFPAGAPTGVPGPVDDKVPTDTVTLAAERVGTLFLNFTAKDAANAASSGATPNQAALDMHLKRTGETQDVMTVDSKAVGTLKATVDAGAYTLTIKPRGGVNLTYEGTLTILYDLVPPPKPAPYADITSGDAPGGRM